MQHFQEALVQKLEFTLLCKILELICKIKEAKKKMELRMRSGSRGMENEMFNDDSVRVKGRVEHVLSPIHGPGEPLEGNQNVIQPVLTSEFNESRAIGQPQEKSVYMRAENKGFELIQEQLKVWKADINKIVSDGQVRVIAMKEAISNLQLAVFNISASAKCTQSMITEVQSRLSNVYADTSDRIDTQEAAASDRLGAL